MHEFSKELNSNGFIASRYSVTIRALQLNVIDNQVSQEFQMNPWVVECKKTKALWFYM